MVESEKPRNWCKIFTLANFDLHCCWNMTLCGMHAVSISYIVSRFAAVGSENFFIVTLVM